MQQRFDVSQMIDDFCSKPISSASGSDSGSGSGSPRSPRSPREARVTELEFTQYMLMAMEKADERVLIAIHNQFKELDPTGSGGLDQNALRKLERQSNKGKSQAWAANPGPRRPSLQPPGVEATTAAVVPANASKEDSQALC